MFKNKVVIIALCGILAAASAGCGKAKPVYETVEAAEEYEELRNIKIYSDTDQGESVNISANVTENTEGTITSGGSTTPKATDQTPSPGENTSSGSTPAPTSTQVSPSSGNSGNSSASSGQTAPSINYNTGSGPFSAGTVVQTNPAHQGTTATGSSASVSQSQTEASIRANTIIRTLKISRTKIVDKNGVVVTATGTSDKGVDISIVNSNTYDVTVTVKNVRVNNIDMGLSGTKTVKAGETIYTSIPITDQVLRVRNIKTVHNISTDVDINDTKKTSGAPSVTTTPVPTTPVEETSATTPTTAPAETPVVTSAPEPTADPTVIPTGFPSADPTAAPVTPRQTVGPTPSSQGGDVVSGTTDYGTLIKEGDGFALYAKYVREDFIYDSGILITTVNNTGELMSITCTSMTVNGRQSLGGFTAEAHRGTTTSCFHVGGNKVFSDMQSVSLNIKVKSRYSDDVLWETGNFVVNA